MPDHKMDRRLRIKVISFLAVIVWIFPAVARPGQLPQSLKDELTEMTAQLGELMREDVEGLTVINQSIMSVYLQNVITRYSERGAIISFAAEGRGGGNLFQQYIALFAILDRDDIRLRDMGEEKLIGKHAQLLAFAQIPPPYAGQLLWDKAQITPTHVSVPLNAKTCFPPDCTAADRQRPLIIAFNSNVFEPNLSISRGAPNHAPRARPSNHP